MSVVVLGALRGLGRLPLWVWLFLALAIYAGYLHRQVEQARRAAFGATEAAAIAAEAKIAERLKAYDAQGRAVEAKLAELGRQGAAAAARTRQVEADLAGARAAGERLETTGTVDEVVRFGRSLGYHPLPARRPPP